MNEAIGQVLPLAVVAALSPFPIIAVVLMLATPRARTNGPAFLLGWIVGITAVGTIVLLVSSGVRAAARSPSCRSGWSRSIISSRRRRPRWAC